MSHEKPKRSYRRNSVIDALKFSDAVDEAVETEIEAAIDRGDIEDADMVEVVTTHAEEKPIRFLGEEPVNNSLTKKVMKKLGYDKTMENIPWKGHDRWVCSRCRWETFDAKRARIHSC